MKNKSFIGVARNIAFMAAVLVTGSCLEYTVKTTVNRDGSLIREYTVKGDSSDIFKGTLRIPSGKDWTIAAGFDQEAEKDAKEKQYIYTASRKFSTVGEFREWLDSDTASGTVKIKVNLHKRFRWFYTYYEYTEVYPMSFPFTMVPVDSFLSEIEQSVLKEDGRTAYAPSLKKMIWKSDTLNFHYNHADSLEMKKIEDNCEDKLGLWMFSAILTEYADLVKSNSMDDPSLSDITDKLLQHTRLIRDKVFSVNDSSVVKLLIFMGDSLAGGHGLSAFYARNPQVFNDFENKIKRADEIDFSDNYEYSLSMPGKVYSSNASERDLLQLTWKFSPMQYFMKEFEMKAESRVANLWIMIITAISATGMVLFLLAKRR